MEFFENRSPADCPQFAAYDHATEFLRDVLVHRGAGGASVVRDCPYIGRCLGAVAWAVNSAEATRILIPGFRRTRHDTHRISSQGNPPLTLQRKNQAAGVALQNSTPTPNPKPITFTANYRGGIIHSRDASRKAGRNRKPYEQNGTPPAASGNGADPLAAAWNSALIEAIGVR